MKQIIQDLKKGKTILKKSLPPAGADMLSAPFKPCICNSLKPSVKIHTLFVRIKEQTFNNSLPRPNKGTILYQHPSATDLNAGAFIYSPS